MDLFLKRLAQTIGIAIAVFSLFAVSVPYVVANQQASGGEITSFVTDKESYLSTGRRVIVDIDIHNPDNFIRDYQVSLDIIAPSGVIVFERVSTVEEGIGQITVDPNGTESIRFIWEDKLDGTRGPTRKSEAGTYTVEVTLRDWDDFDLILDSRTENDAINFSIQARPFLEVSEESLDFGTIVPGDIPRRSFNVLNSGNGTLEWSIDDWPESWLKLISPTSTSITGPEAVIFEVRPDPQLSEPFIGSIRITSNAGEEEVDVSGEIAGKVSGLVNSINSTALFYRQGDDVTLEFEVENDGGVRLGYRSGITILDPEDQIVFDGLAVEDDIVFSLNAETEEVLSYIWQVPLDFEAGNYTATVSLRYLHDSNLVFHDLFDDAFIPSASQPRVSTIFEIRDGPLLGLSHEEWDFGTILVGETAEASFDVINSRAATISWEVVGLPNWVEMEGPPGQRAGGGSVVLNVNSNLAPGAYDGNLEISSNGGDGAIALSLFVQEPATATPTAAPTSTPAPPTSTPIPTTPTPEPTDTPEPPTATPEPPTSTPVPPTRTPAPTATPSPPTATATVPPSPTAAPTSTSTSETLAAAPPEAEEEPESSGGCGSSQGRVSAATASANALFLLAPIGLLAMFRRIRRMR